MSQYSVSFKAQDLKNWSICIQQAFKHGLQNDESKKFPLIREVIKGYSSSIKFMVVSQAIVSIPVDLETIAQNDFLNYLTEMNVHFDVLEMQCEDIKQELWYQIIRFSIDCASFWQPQKIENLLP